MSKLVSFKVAELAKQKGFDIKIQQKNQVYDCFLGVIDKNFISDDVQNWNDKKYADICSAPTQSLLQSWLRDKHNLNISIQLGYGIPNSWWSYFIQSIKDDSLIVNTENIFYSYEEALEDGLYEALKIIEK